MTFLSTMKKAEIVAVAADLKRAGIAVIALPASDVCMMAREDDGNTRRCYMKNYLNNW